MQKSVRAREVLRRLKKTYTEQGEFVHWRNPLELVVGTMLSAQCTDERVNRVTMSLFKKYNTASDYARAGLRSLEREIYSTGFYKNKARHLKGIGKMIVKRFDGKVPASFNELTMLPGISTKSAHLIMSKAFGKPTGIAVDTHVLRLAPRLGLTKHARPEKIGHDLEKFYKSHEYNDVNEYFIMHGRAICKPRPLCGQCALNNICPSAKKFIKKRT